MLNYIVGCMHFKTNVVIMPVEAFCRCKRLAKGRLHVRMRFQKQTPLPANKQRDKTMHRIVEAATPRQNASSETDP